MTRKTNKSWRIHSILMKRLTHLKDERLCGVMGISLLTCDQWRSGRWKASAQQLQRVFLLLWTEAVCKDYGADYRIVGKEKLKHLAALRLALRIEDRELSKISRGLFKRSVTAICLWAIENTEVEDHASVKEILRVFDR